MPVAITFGPVFWVILTLGLLVAGLVWRYRPYIAGAFPRVTALAWPYPLTGLILVAGILLGGFLLMEATLRLWWSAPFFLLHAESADPSSPGWLSRLAWLWPWLPAYLLLLVLLYPAARVFSRRVFHAVVSIVLLSMVLGVALQGERTARPAAAPMQPVFMVSPFTAATTLNDCLIASSQAPLSSSLPVSSIIRSALSAGCPDGGLPVMMVPWSLAAAGQSSDAVAIERFAARVIEPTFHRENTGPGIVTSVFFGLGLLLTLGWLDRLNLRRALLPIRVGSISGVDGKPRPDLEQLMRECLHRNAPHAPSPLPGGEMLYWQDFVEQQSSKDEHWLSRTVALVLRFLHPPGGLEVRGTLVEEYREAGRPHHSRRRHGIRVNMVDIHSNQTLMALTFWSDEKVEHAIELAAYSAAERALEVCRKLPEWVYWRDDSNGDALRQYYQGLDVFGQGSGEKHLAHEARIHLREAAKRSPGSALARLQLAEILDADGDEVGAVELYLDLISRYPRLLVAHYRLASVCRTVAAWAPRLQEWRQHRDLRAWQAYLNDMRLHGYFWPRFGDMPPWLRIQESLSCSCARRLRKPTWLGRLYMMQRTQSQTLRSWRCFRSVEPLELSAKKWPYEPIQEDDTRTLQALLLDVGSRALEKHERACRWWVWLWCIGNTAERRLFRELLLWPPRKRRATLLSIRASRCCIELHQLLLLNESGPLDDWMKKQYQRRRARCLRRAEQLAIETKLAARVIDNHLGLVHYNLACFRALQLQLEGVERGVRIPGPGPLTRWQGWKASRYGQKSERLGQKSFQLQGKVRELAKRSDALKERPVYPWRLEAWWLDRRKAKLMRKVAATSTRSRELCKRSDTMAGRVLPDDESLGRLAINHLTYAMKDPDGPFSAGTWKWLLRYPELASIHELPAFRAWGRAVLRQWDVHKEIEEPPKRWWTSLLSH
ncbi:hypothetical protein JRI60_27305 [Archangium violaceum]|uniref:tetratricopeptide repeat protein n=1 Tax=Archangium violaceum TaxID=83451 RepID=UPI001950252F|nr:hypothetical protein [Archangium violaceum]QRN92920.1 hypothetical protein JRI60_27305 [Archangium violaceum]